MNRVLRQIVAAVVALLLIATTGEVGAQTVYRPQFTAELVKKQTPGHAVNIDVDINGKRELYLVTTGSGYADWAQPRLVGPKSEKKLTELKWRFAAVGWDMVRTNMNSWGRPLTINGKQVPYGFTVHAPSVIIFDLPPGYTRFKAQAGLDDGGSGKTTFSVFVDNPMLDRRNAALWQRRRDPPSPPADEPYVEMIGGDRLPGEVVDFRFAGTSPYDVTPPHFVVQPSIDAALPAGWQRAKLRVIERFVRRVAWKPRPGDRYEPGTVFFGDGRSAPFRSARFNRGFVQLLSEKGIETAAFAEIAEIHFPRRDPWEAYYDELAVLSPDGRSSIVYLETAGGVRLTGSAERFHARGHGPANRQLRWWAVVQPAWCLDPIYVADDAIVARSVFAPHQAPLSRISPEEARPADTLSGRGWSRRIDRNVQGGVLESGGRLYRYGFGVHAPSELTFTLPGAARTFRSRIGLDRIAGAGGCVRARVFVGGTRGKPLFESPFLVGSQQTVDTGAISLPANKEADAQLVLQVDSAHRGRPAGADPLDIRDTLDWLEPTVDLDATIVRQEVAKRTSQPLPIWKDWAVDPDKASYRLVNYWDNIDPAPSGYRRAVVVQGRPLTLSRQVQIGEETSWLVLGVSRPHNWATEPPSIEVCVDGEKVAQRAVPIRDAERPNPMPLAVSLGKYAGKSVKLDVVQSAGDARSLVHWEAIRLADRIPTLRCLFEDAGKFHPVDPASKGEATLVEDGPYVGDRAVRIAAPGQCRLPGPQKPCRIREYPDWDEYRYLRFAFRKTGEGRVCVEVNHQEEAGRRIGFDAGRGEPCLDDAQRIWHLTLPDAWIVETIDLFARYGELDVTGLTLTVPDGKHALFDHIYLARSLEDFASLPQSPEPEETMRLARRTLARPVLDKVLPATVAIDRANGFWGTGIIVDGRKGLILTTGHLIAGRKELDVYLADGSMVKARRLGIDRGNDIGALQLVDKAVRPSVSIDFTPRTEYPHNAFFLAVSHAKAYQKGDRPAAYICTVRGRRPSDGLVQAQFSYNGRCRGGPLVSREGNVIGVHTRIDTPSFECLYKKTEDFAATWGRIAKGEVFGTWHPLLGPKIGVIVHSMHGGCRVTAVDPLSPAKKAQFQVNDMIVKIDNTDVKHLHHMLAYLCQKDPDDEVTVHFKRGNETKNVKVRLMQHRLLSPK